MKSTLFTIAGLAALGLCLPAAAQQIAPVIDRTAASACAPKDMVTALACLDQHLKPEVKADIQKATAQSLEVQEIYVGLWIRNGWSLWSGTELTQFLDANGVPQVERQSERILQAYWLKEKGCRYDWNNVPLVIAAISQARAGGDACTAVAGRGGAAAGRGGAAAGRGAAGRAGAAGRGGAAAPGRGAATATPPTLGIAQPVEVDDSLNPNQ